MTEGKKRLLSFLAFMLLLVGFLLPIVCWAFWLPEPLLFAACGAVVLAFIIGMRAWSLRLAKIAVVGSILFGLLGIWLGWAGFPTYQLAVRPTADWMKPLDTDWVLQSPGKPYSIQTDSELKVNGDPSLRFEIRGGEKWIDQTFLASFRSEVATKEFPSVNSVKWYSFSVFFPANFPVEDNRLVFAQWHDGWHLFQPGRVPPLAFRFVRGQFSITLRHSAEHFISDPDSAPSKRLFKENQFSLGRWQDFVVQAKWSFKEDGLINVWWNGKQIVEYRGPVGYDDSVGPQFKFGLYRNDTDKTYIAYYNHVKSGSSPADVDFNPALSNHALSLGR